MVSRVAIRRTSAATKDIIGSWMQDRRPVGLLPLRVCGTLLDRHGRLRDPVRRRVVRVLGKGAHGGFPLLRGRVGAGPHLPRRPARGGEIPRTQPLPSAGAGARPRPRGARPDGGRSRGGAVARRDTRGVTLRLRERSEPLPVGRKVVLGRTAGPPCLSATFRGTSCSTQPLSSDDLR